VKTLDRTLVRLHEMDKTHPSSTGCAHKVTLYNKRGIRFRKSVADPNFHPVCTQWILGSTRWHFLDPFAHLNKCSKKKQKKTVRIAYTFLSSWVIQKKTRACMIIFFRGTGEKFDTHFHNQQSPRFGRIACPPFIWTSVKRNTKSFSASTKKKQVWSF